MTEEEARKTGYLLIRVDEDTICSKCGGTIAAGVEAYCHSTAAPSSRSLRGPSRVHPGCLHFDPAFCDEQTSKKIDYVVDTNVMLDLFSWHNLMEERARPDASLRDDNVRYRIARHGAALRLAVWFHENEATTLSLKREGLRLFLRCVPPKPSGTDLNSDYTTTFINVIKPRALPGWHAGTTDVDANISGDEADGSLVREAKRLNVPLVTNEEKEKGTVRKTAALANVRVVSPRELLTSKGFDERAVAAFLDKLAALVNEEPSDGRRDFMAQMLRTWKFVLRTKWLADVA